MGTWHAEAEGRAAIQLEGGVWRLGEGGNSGPPWDLENRRGLEGLSPREEDMRETGREPGLHLGVPEHRVTERER